MSESQCSCIIQEFINRGKYAYMGLWVKYALVKSCGVSKITPVRSKNRRITISMFLSTLQLTALLLKKFCLRLHCYTLSLWSRGLSFFLSFFLFFSCLGSFLKSVCALLCFIKPILGNHYVRSRGFIVSEPRETHPRSEIADIPTLPCPPLDDLGCQDPHPPP